MTSKKWLKNEAYQAALLARHTAVSNNELFIPRRFKSGVVCKHCGTDERYIATTLCVKCQISRHGKTYNADLADPKKAKRLKERREAVRIARSLGMKHFNWDKCQQCGDTRRYTKCDECVTCKINKKGGRLRKKNTGILVNSEFLAAVTPGGTKAAATVHLYEQTKVPEICGIYATDKASATPQLKMNNRLVGTDLMVMPGVMKRLWEDDVPVGGTELTFRQVIPFSVIEQSFKIIREHNEK